MTIYWKVGDKERGEECLFFWKPDLKKLASGIKKAKKRKSSASEKKHTSLEGSNSNTSSTTNSPARARSGSSVYNMAKIQREDSNSTPGESPEPKLKPHGQIIKKKLLGTNNGIEQAFDLLDLWVATPNQKRRRTGKRKDHEPLSEETPKKRRSSRLKFTPITLPGTTDQLKQKSPKDEKKTHKKRKTSLGPSYSSSLRYHHA